MQIHIGDEKDQIREGVLVVDEDCDISEQIDFSSDNEDLESVASESVET